ncbi:MAG: hypothetical protein EZS28_017429 [Streblomastix strix]|uniref:Uncharacterized protein n=1 Tax=Streblomastix strix TaxID=222440 RepID=A0A5J4VXH6_9EUKA|nr:MAG: hypothetical protein EZS28_017429 [Streblomastix strix]
MQRGRSGPLPFQQGRGGRGFPGRGHGQESRGPEIYQHQIERDQLLTGDPKQAWSVGRDQWQMGRGKFAIGLPFLSIAPSKGNRLKSLDELTEDELIRCGMLTNTDFDDAESTSNIQYIAPIPSPQLTPTHLTFDSDDDNDINNNDIGEDELLMLKKKRKRDENFDSQQSDNNTDQGKEAENKGKIIQNKTDQQKIKGMLQFSPINQQNNSKAQNPAQNSVQMKIDRQLKTKINQMNNIFDALLNLNKALQIDINSTAHALQTLDTQRKKAELQKNKKYEDKIINLKENQLKNDDPIQIAIDLVNQKGAGASRLQMVCIDDRGWKQKASGIKLESQSEKAKREQQQKLDSKPSRSPPHIQTNNQYNQNNGQYNYNNSQGRGYTPYSTTRPQSQPNQVQNPQIHYPRAQIPQNIVQPHQFNAIQPNSVIIPPSSHSQPIQSYDSGRGSKRRREYE